MGAAAAALLLALGRRRGARGGERVPNGGQTDQSTEPLTTFREVSGGVFPLTPILA